MGGGRGEGGREELRSEQGTVGIKNPQKARLLSGKGRTPALGSGIETLNSLKVKKLNLGFNMKLGPWRDTKFARGW